MVRETNLTVFPIIAVIILAVLNIITQPVEAKTEPIIGVYYFPGWYRAAGDPSGEYSEWRSAIMKAAVPRPLCGFYNDADPRLWEYYIRWMTTHGIDFIAFDWYYNAGQEYLYESLDRGFLQSKHNEQIKFCIHWCNHGGSWWRKPLDQSKSATIAMTDILCARYFHKPNYLRIAGRPVLMVYDVNTLLNFGGQSGVRETLAAMRRHVRSKGYRGLYLVAVYAGSSPEYIAMLKNLGFDAFCAYTYCWIRPPSVKWDTQAVPYADIAEMLSAYLYPYLQRVGTRAGIPYWPSTFAGWDDRPRAGIEKAFLNIGTTPQAFEKMFRSALNHVNPSSPVVLVEAWNEWGEGACIEPSKLFGFEFLKAIAKSLGKKALWQETPTPQEISSWSVLTPEELKVAEENETKPWPGKTPNWARMGKSFDAPEVKMPYILDFTSNGLPVEKLTLNNTAVVEQTAEGTLFETTGHDPMVIVCPIQVPTHQIKRIIIDGEVIGSIPEDPMQREIELFWTTGLIPEFTQFASGTCSWAESPNPSISISELPMWKATGTPMTGLRLDPCSGPGLRFRLRRIVLSGE